jgi:2-oxoglutarate ferredoxin oxidoreductase subunit gamma
MNKAHKITIAGFGGQGVMMLGQMLAYAGNEVNLNTLWFPAYGPETRGGTANCAVIISPQDINSPVFAKADCLIVFNKPSFDKFVNKVENNGVIFYNSSLISDVSVNNLALGIPVNDIASQLGNAKVINMVMLGAYLEHFQTFSQEIIEKVLIKMLGKDKAAMVDINLQALKAGREFVKNLGVKYVT